MTNFLQVNDNNNNNNNRYIYIIFQEFNISEIIRYLTNNLKLRFYKFTK